MSSVVRVIRVGICVNQTIEKRESSGNVGLQLTVPS
jgi:hypothetical protein